ncbi:MAG: hypothetical protein KF900_00255 [Bacteroidetes bacterium]|nr:hypothetical protein [Bacteroidota bacterium]
MKKIILLGAFFLSLNAFAQEEPNCYTKWAEKFDTRGADEIKDGVYEDVIISSRQGKRAVCYNGKAIVNNGTIVKAYILLVDGSYDEVRRTWQNGSDKNVSIENGISKTMTSVYGESVNILFPKKLKPKKANPSLAAEPTDE